MLTQLRALETKVPPRAWAGEVRASCEPELAPRRKGNHKPLPQNHPRHDNFSRGLDMLPVGWRRPISAEAETVWRAEPSNDDTVVEQVL